MFVLDLLVLRHLDGPLYARVSIPFRWLSAAVSALKRYAEVANPWLRKALSVRTLALRLRANLSEETLHFLHTFAPASEGPSN